jgi:hypothetical protein
MVRRSTEFGDACDGAGASLPGPVLVYQLDKPHFLWRGACSAKSREAAKTASRRQRFLARQVHLGFYQTEEQAARAYDRAAINKGAGDGGKIITNFDINDYAPELGMLQRISQTELVNALADERWRQCLATLTCLHPVWC